MSNGEEISSEEMINIISKTQRQSQAQGWLAKIK